MNNNSYFLHLRLPMDPRYHQFKCGAETARTANDESDPYESDMSYFIGMFDGVSILTPKHRSDASPHAPRRGWSAEPSSRSSTHTSANPLRGIGRQEILSADCSPRLARGRQLLSRPAESGRAASSDCMALPEVLGPRGVARRETDGIAFMTEAAPQNGNEEEGSGGAFVVLQTEKRREGHRRKGRSRRSSAEPRTHPHTPTKPRTYPTQPPSSAPTVYRSLVSARYHEKEEEGQAAWKRALPRTTNINTNPSLSTEEMNILERLQKAHAQQRPGKGKDNGHGMVFDPVYINQILPVLKPLIVVHALCACVLRTTRDTLLMHADTR